jgi:AraC-like DNA-binding protein
VPPFYPTEREAREIFASSTDAVSALIRRVRVRSVIPGLCSFSAPWGLCMNAPTGGFFVVRSGTLHAKTDGVEHERLGAGDTVVFFHAGKHWVGDPPGAATKAPFEIISRQDMRRRRGMEVVQGAPTVTFFTGGFVDIDGIDAGILKQLPPMLVMRTKDPDRPAMLERFLSAAEAANEHQGTRDLANDLIGNAVFCSAMHVAFSRLGAVGTGANTALMFDPDLGPVMRLVHDFPERGWTMQSLADEAGLSRSSFHERFVAAAKIPPMAYLRSLRLALAKQLLATGERDLGRIARRVGYGSVSSFAAAYRREFAIPPTPLINTDPGP